MQKALFLDRDGVINVDHGYVSKREDFEFKEGIFELLKNIDYPIFVITNQSGIGRGYYTQQDFETLTSYMLLEFQKRGIEITRVYFCPHAPSQECECRKPSPKMILDAADRYNIDLNSSTFIGDKKSDMLAAKDAGISRKIFVGNGCDVADEVVENIKQIKGLKSV